MIIPTNNMSTTSTGEYDPWIDTDDDGDIDVYDIVAMCNIYGSTGAPMNKTGSLLEFLDKVETLQGEVEARARRVNLCKHP